MSGRKAQPGAGRKTPKGLAPAENLLEALDPIRRYHKAATDLAKRIPFTNAEELADWMNNEGAKYGSALELYWAGSIKEQLKAVSNMAIEAGRLLMSISKLGPVARSMALRFEGDGYHSWLKTDNGKWLSALARWEERLRNDLRKPQGRGRPKGSAELQREIRMALLGHCWDFLDPMKETQRDKALKLVPELARAVHRIVCEPDLPKSSRLFDKEWESI